MAPERFSDSLRPLTRQVYGRLEAIAQIDGALAWLEAHPQPGYGPAEIARLRAARAKLTARKVP